MIRQTIIRLAASGALLFSTTFANAAPARASGSAQPARGGTVVRGGGNIARGSIQSPANRGAVFSRSAPGNFNSAGRTSSFRSPGFNSFNSFTPARSAQEAQQRLRDAQRLRESNIVHNERRFHDEHRFHDGKFANRNLVVLPYYSWWSPYSWWWPNGYGYADNYPD